MRLTRITRFIIAILLVFLFFTSICMAGKKPDKSSGSKQKTADIGSFGVYVNGNRVATETFRIEQTESVSIVTSDFRTDSGNKLSQTAELQIAPNGNLRRYTWNEKSPGKGQITVELSGEFLVENVTPDPPDKPQSLTLLLTPATAVLDDYMFSHREVLLWRYLAQSCGSTMTAGCTLPKVQFGALVPRQQTSAIVIAEYKGKEKTMVKGTERVLDRFSLVFEGDEWTCFMDENIKLVKIVIPSEKTEVVRD